MTPKEAVGQEVARRIRSGEVIGIGTGSTVDAALIAIGARIQSEGLRVLGVPTSYESAWKCSEMGISVCAPESVSRLTWGFDGADEVDPELRVIKGKGGAMLREKIVAALCDRFVVIVDESKLVSRLGERTAVPVEVVPGARRLVESALVTLGAQSVVLRQAGPGKHGSVITEAGNVILDATFPSIGATLEREIKSLVGVVESGIFNAMAHEVIVAGSSGIRVLRK